MAPLRRRRRGHRRGARGRERAGAALLARPHDRRSVLDPRARAGREWPVPRLLQGGMPPDGAGRRPQARRCRSSPPIATAAAEPRDALPGAARRDDGVPRLPAALAPAAPSSSSSISQFDGADPRGHHLGRRDRRRGQGRLARRRDRRGHGRHPGRDPPDPGGAARSRSSRRTPAPAAPGGRTATPARGSTSPSHQYCYAFEPADHWSEYYCQHPELRALLHARARQVRRCEPHCRFETEVTGADWDEASRALAGRRPIGGRPDRGARRPLRHLGGRLAQHPADARHRRHGDLRRPRRSIRPAGPRTSTTAGCASRCSARARAASRSRPTIADEVEHLSIFQRTAQWVMPNPIYHTKVPAGETWAMRHLPFFARWLRFMMTQPGIGSGVESFRIDPEPRRSRQPVGQRRRTRRAATALLDFMRSHLGDRPDLIEKVHARLPGAGQARPPGQRQLVPLPQEVERRARAHRRSSGSCPRAS